ncbi:Vitamin B12 import ATP-binding protein BtuD [subsurface metagenome]
MSHPIISVKNIGKKYKLGATLGGRNYKTLRDVLTQVAFGPFRKLSAAFRKEPFADGIHLPPNNLITQSPNNQNAPPSAPCPLPPAEASPHEFWALKDISFDVQQGEVVGIIGRNGAGKSTLLKILSQITEPTEGEIRIRGRVASLLEIGTGFHPELSGRENAYMNGAILGMTKAEIDAKFDEIVAFAEVEKFIDTPIKRYSSGMQVRLAFAVAAHLEPEILVVDEVLAVGDAAFQKKCLGKMGDVAGEGRTVLFVSHNMAAIQTLCTKAIYLDAGRVISMGDVDEQVGVYLNELQKKKQANLHGPIKLSPDIQLKRFEFHPNPVESCGKGEFLAELWSLRPVKIEALAILLSSSMTMRVAIIDLRHSESYSLGGLESVLIKGNIRSLPLVEGKYSLGLYYKYEGIEDHLTDIMDLEITTKSGAQNIIPYPPAARGVVQLDTTFRVEYNKS